MQVSLDQQEIILNLDKNICFRERFREIPLFNQHQKHNIKFQVLTHTVIFQILLVTVKILLAYFYKELKKRQSDFADLFTNAHWIRAVKRSNNREQILSKHV